MKHLVSHRRRGAVGVVAAVLAVAVGTGCSGVPAPDTAASVGSATLSHADLAQIMEINGIPTTSADDARATTSSWIVLRSANDLLADQGVEPTEAQEAAARTQLESIEGWDDLPDSTKRVAVDFAATNALLTELSQSDGLDVNAFIAEALDAADIEVDPRIGTFDSIEGVVALGR